ncbi:MAG: helix-turn-helix domain-containing protein [Cellulosilyticaceae bacterium]
MKSNYIIAIIILGDFMDIGMKIKEIRKDNGLTQQQLATLLSMTKSSLQKYENGQTTVTVDLLERISTALDIDIISFFSNDTASVLCSIKKFLNIRNDTNGQLEYDFNLFMQFLKFKYTQGK